MRNSDTNSKRANWLACGIAVVLCLAMLLYVFPPSLGRALQRAACLRQRRRWAEAPDSRWRAPAVVSRGIHGHFTTGGIDDRIESTLPPVLRPKIVPRS